MRLWLALIISGCIISVILAYRVESINIKINPSNNKEDIQ